MFEVKGQFNTAKVMLPVGSIDESTLTQVKGLADFEPLSGATIVIMPDCHAGKGCTVGTTISGFNVIVPNLIGVDIGCGMYTIPMPEPIVSDDQFQEIDSLIRTNIPYGFGINDRQVAELDQSDNSNFTKLSEKIGSDSDRMLKSIGSLGSGNHFYEIGEAPSGQQQLIVHSGSRNFGLRVCQYHQSRAVEYCKSKNIQTPIGLEYLPFGDGAEDYLEDMMIAQKYAEINRETMVRRLFELFYGSADLTKAYHCTHNYISNGYIRKGAISASVGERVIIPLNMRDGIIFGTGNGSCLWNNSAPHGAGRLYSRNQAKKQLSMDDFKESMKGIWTSSVSRDTLDECPQSYKPAKLILEAIQETVKIEAVYKPVYNFKAGKE